MTPIAGAKEANLEERANKFSDYDVRVRAHQIWVRNGSPEGNAEFDWREALAELVAEGLLKSGPVPAFPQVSSSPTRGAAAPRQDMQVSTTPRKSA